MRVRYHVPITVVLMVAGCGGAGDKSDTQFTDEIVAGMHQLVLAQIQGLNQAAHDLQDAAPSPVGRGWDATMDQPQIALMKSAWDRTRLYWEQGEGTLGCLFADLDGSLDARYEDGAAGDLDLFDGQGMIGMHAVERILFAPTIPPAVTAFETTLPGYQAAAWPANEMQAMEFKTGLCQQLVSDTQSLLDQWKSRAIDLPVVFYGITGLMSAQAEKLGLAVEQKEESRYSQKTMADLRFNLMGTAGVQAAGGATAGGGIYDLFTPWLLTKAYGATLDSAAKTSFAGLAQTYATVQDDAVPSPPASWNSSMPTPDDQQSTFGKLYEAVVQEVDPTRSGSAVEVMNQVAKALGLPAQSCPM